MNENSMILQDNLFYLNAWFSRLSNKNPNIKVFENKLLWNHDQITEQISLNEFYLPSLLYNHSFQMDLQRDQLTWEDLFRIIRIHQYALDYQKEKQLSQNFITSFEIKKDENNQDIILITNSIGKQYVIRNQILKVQLLYEQLHKQNTDVNFELFQKELEKI